MRSRVTPGMSWTIAIRRPTRRLKRADFPTLGRPTIATWNGLTGIDEELGAPALALDLGTKLEEFFVDHFISAIDVVKAVDFGGAFGT